MASWHGELSWIDSTQVWLEAKWNMRYIVGNWDWSPPSIDDNTQKIKERQSGSVLIWEKVVEGWKELILDLCVYKSAWGGGTSRTHARCSREYLAIRWDWTQEEGEPLDYRNQMIMQAGAVQNECIMGVLWFQLSSLNCVILTLIKRLGWWDFSHAQYGVICSKPLFILNSY